MQFDTHELILLATAANVIVGLLRLFQECRTRHKVDRLLEIIERHLEQGFG
jgi:hypothetical protein